MNDLKLLIVHDPADSPETTKLKSDIDQEILGRNIDPADRPTIELQAGFRNLPDPSLFGALSLIVIFLPGRAFDAEEAEEIRVFRRKSAPEIRLVPVASSPERNRPPEPLDDIKSVPLHSGGVAMLTTVLLNLLYLRLSGELRRVYISYKISDGISWAEKVAKGLRDRGYDVWANDDSDSRLDNLSMLTQGEPAQATIQDAILRQGFVLVIDTMEAPLSGWVQEEVSTAIRHRLPVLPVVIDDAIPPKDHRLIQVPKPGGRFRALQELGLEVRVPIQQPGQKQDLDSAFFDRLEAAMSTLLLGHLRQRRRQIQGQQNQPNNHPIVTFYSFKGGTGRSMALANVAWILASNGCRVLVLDWDLEAPGLHRFFAPFLDDPELKTSDGVIDWVLAFATEAATPVRSADPPTDVPQTEPSRPGKQKPRLKIPPERLAALANILPYATTLNYKFSGKGCIDFVPAGRQDSTYPDRLGSINWWDLYGKMGGGVFLDAARQKMKAEYDYVLIDSRTGVSDTSGICTIQLPDILVACYTANNQGIRGLAGIAASVRKQVGPLLRALDPLPANRRGPAKIFPVLTRVDSSESDKLQRRRALAKQEFDPILRELFPASGDRDEYFATAEIPYVAYYSYEEVLAPFKDEPNRTATVLNAIERLTHNITCGAVSRLGNPPDPGNQTLVLSAYQSLGKEAGAGQISKRGVSAPDVYLSFSGPDMPSVRAICDKLIAERIVLWTDEFNNPVGENWKDEAVRARTSSPTVVICLGPSGMSEHQREEVHILTTGGSIEQRQRLIPVFLPGTTSHSIPDSLRTYPSVEFRSSLDDEQAFTRLNEAIRGSTAKEAAPTIIDSPYRGLEPFDEKSGQLFFGRKKQVADLIELVRRAADPGENRLIGVVGPSGCGKTSLVRAGLLPALLPGGEIGQKSGWPVVYFRPGFYPLQNLAKAINQVRGERGKVVSDAVLGSIHDIDVALADLAGPGPLVLIVDQFDELFSQGLNSPEHTLLTTYLLKDSSRSEKPIVVMVMRSSDPIWPFHTRSLTLEPMTHSDLREAIERPAQLVGYEVEPGLVELLLEATDGAPGGLGLIQIATQELWRRRDGRRLTISAYTELGGVGGLLERRANEFYGSLSTLDQSICRSIFLRLSRHWKQRSFLPRTALLENLSPAPGASPSQLESVIGHLIDARLLTLSDQPTLPDWRPKLLVEPSHAVLIESWPVFQHWVGGQEGPLDDFHELIRAAELWKWSVRRQDYLYSDSQIRLTQEAISKLGLSLNSQEEEFILASRVYRRRNARLRWTLRSISVLFLLSAAVGCSFYFNWYYQRQLSAKTGQLDSDFSAKTDQLSTDFSAKMDQLNSNFSKEKINLSGQIGALHQKLNKKESELSRQEVVRLTALSRLAVSENNRPVAALLAVEAVHAAGNTPLTADLDQTLHLVVTGPRLLSPSVNPNTPPVFSRDNRMLAAVGLKGGLDCWDLTAPNPAAFPTAVFGSGEITAMALAPDGRWLVTGDPNGKVSYAAPAEKGAELKQLVKFEAPIRLLAINSDFQLVIVDESGSTQLWGLLDLKPQSPPSPALGSIVRRVAISPEKRQVVMATTDNRIVVLRLGQPGNEPIQVPLDRPLSQLAVSPDGRWMITSDGTENRIWDLSAPNLAAAWAVIGGIDGAVTYLAVSPDSKKMMMMYTANDAGKSARLRLWNIPSMGTVVTPITLPEFTAVIAADFGPDSQQVAIVESTRIVSLCRFGNGSALVRLGKLPDPPTKESRVRVAFSPDGRWLVTATSQYYLWPLSTDRLVSLAKQQASRNFTTQEWEQYFPGRPYQSTFPDLPPGN